MTNYLIIYYFLTYGLLLCGFLYFVKTSWFYKTLMVAGIIFIGSGVFFAFESYKGWPAVDKLPPKVQLLAVDIVEPSKEKEGIIYILVRELRGKPEGSMVDNVNPMKMFQYSAEETAPRLMRIPYSMQSAGFYARAAQALKDGMVVVVDSGEGDEAGQGAGGLGLETSKNKTKNQELEIIDPQTLMDRKDG